MTENLRTARDPQPQGFVLVGVVIFVLALTILGASLFSLSTYEGEFYGQSSDRAQAFYAAMGGIERAKYILATKKNLTDVWQNGQSGDIQLTRARRVPFTGVASDTNGAIVWGQPVDIRVLAIHNGARRMIEQRFTPQQPKTVYRRLITATDRVEIVRYENSDPTYRPPQTYVDGDVWQQSPDTSWTALAQLDIALQRQVLVTPVPNPDAVGYRAAHLAGSTSIDPDGPFNGQNHQYRLNQGGPGSVKFYETSGLNGSPPFIPLNQYTIMCNGGASPKIMVSGTAIWLVQHGFWSDQTVTVQGLPTDLLIIVASPPVGTDPDNAALYFQGGLDSPTVPVLLVTDGDVDIEALSAATVSTTDSYLSIFAHHVLLGGPRPGSAARFMHPSSLPLIDGVVDGLYDLQLLPNSNAGISAQFPPVHRTWREVTDTYPN